MSQDPTVLIVYDSRRGQAEGREHERVLACYPYDLDINEQTVMTGFAQAQRAFLNGETDSRGPVTVLTMRDKTWVVEEIEPGIHLLLVVNRSLWGQRDGPKDNVLREYASLAATLLLGTIGPVQQMLDDDPTGTEVRLMASPVLGATVLAFEDVDGPLGRAFLSTPLSECSYPRVLPWSERTKNFCQLLRQELITWSGSRLRRRVLGDGSTRFQGGEHSAQVVIIHTGSPPPSSSRSRLGLASQKAQADPRGSYLVESSLGPRDTQLLYWLGVQALCSEDQLEERGVREDAADPPSTRDEGAGHSGGAVHRSVAGGNPRQTNRALFSDEYTSVRVPSQNAARPPASSSSTASSWFMDALAKALPFGKSDGHRTRQPSGYSNASDSPRSSSSLWDWGSASPRHHRYPSSGNALSSPNGSSLPSAGGALDLNAAATRIGSFLASAPEPSSGGSLLSQRASLPAPGEGSYRGYAYEGSYRNSRVGLGVRASAGNGLDGGVLASPPTASLAVSSAVTTPHRAADPVLTADGSYRGGNFTWANCYASVAISAKLRREFQDDDLFEHPAVAAQVRGLSRRSLEGVSPHAPPSSRSLKKARATTPLQPAHWRSFVCDVEVPSSTSQSGPHQDAAHNEPKSLQLVAYFPRTETFRSQFGGRLCTVHLEGPGGTCALVPVRTGPLLFLVAVPLKRLDQSVEAMLRQSRARGAARPEGEDEEPLDVSPSNPQYRKFARERALEVVAGICGDVLLKVADQLAPSAAKDAVEMREGDLRGLRFLARNCLMRQSMATPERKALLISTEASEALERLRAALYEGGAYLPEEPPLPQVDARASPRAVQAAGLRERRVSLGSQTGGAPGGRSAVGPAVQAVQEPPSWSGLALTFSRSLGVVLAADPEADPSTDPPPSPLLPPLNENGPAPLLRDPMARSASTNSLFDDSARTTLPLGMREAIIRAADGSWICALEKFSDKPHPPASSSSPVPSSSSSSSSGLSTRGDPLNCGRKVQLFLVVSRRETKEGARAQLYTLASKLDL